MTGHDRVRTWLRGENALIAAGILVTMIAAGHWWLPLATFLVFDLSALGYLINQRIGALTYNVVHSYLGPAMPAVVWGSLQIVGTAATWLLLFAACWAFHFAVDRALGFGLKLEAFSHTHLSAIG